MRIAIIALLLATACTKRNPEACCTDATDCMSVGLPNITPCDDGLLCRGNRCVEELCTTAGDCDATAPYCVMTDEGRCGEACTADAQCPGFSQAASDTFCVGGGCVECRAGMNDCSGDKPVCSAEGRCVACIAHADCASGVCANGACAAEADVAYVATNGAPASDCLRATPCDSVARALVVIPARPYILVEPGTYTSTSAITLTGTRWVIGRGGRPVFTRSTDGPIIATSGTVDVKLERIETFGARGTTTGAPGDGIQCNGVQGVPKLELLDVISRMNARNGLEGNGCILKASASEFLGNAQSGVTTGEGSSNYDRCIVMNNGFPNGVGGMALDEGIHIVTNTVIARNNYRGLDIFSSSIGNRVELNTIVDNGAGIVTGAGIQCSLSAANNIMTNNIIARNDPDETLGPCVYTNSIIIDSDITPLKFKRPDAAPFDYHLQAGSTAIDMAGTSSVKTDLDGEARPAGAANDVGADELH